MHKSILIFVIFFFTFLDNFALAAVQKTFAMIKPSGLAKKAEIKSLIQSYGLKIYKTKKITMSEEQFNKLYAMHREKPFFNELRNSLVGKDVEVMILQGENAVNKYKTVVMKDIRSKYALNKTENAVHGSDDWARAHEEMCIFFECGKRKRMKKNNLTNKKKDINDVKLNENSIKEIDNKNVNNSNIVAEAENVELQKQN